MRTDRDMLNGCPIWFLDHGRPIVAQVCARGPGRHVGRLFFVAALCFAAVVAVTQEALAHECGINRTYLSGVERSERNVSIDNIARIAKGLRVAPSKLLEDNRRGGDRD